MVVTAEGGTPPPIGELFPEDEKARAKRRGGADLGDWDTTSTYSFSFNSMYVDLPEWKLVSLPMMRDMDLATFWGSAGLRLVVYENGASKKSKHLQAENKYVLCIETKFREGGEEEDGANPRILSREVSGASARALLRSYVSSTALTVTNTPSFATRRTRSLGARSRRRSPRLRASAS